MRINHPELVRTVRTPKVGKSWELRFSNALRETYEPNESISYSGLDVSSIRLIFLLVLQRNPNAICPCAHGSGGNRRGISDLATTTKPTTESYQDIFSGSYPDRVRDN
jgi:hypothetical protein